METVFGSGDAVGLARVDEQIVGLAGLDEGVDEALGVLDVDVVVGRAVDQHQPPAQVSRGLDAGGVGVGLLLLVGQAHVALGVDRIV